VPEVNLEIFWRPGPNVMCCVHIRRKRLQPGDVCVRGPYFCCVWCYVSLVRLGDCLKLSRIVVVGFRSVGVFDGEHSPRVSYYCSTSYPASFPFHSLQLSCNWIFYFRYSFNGKGVKPGWKKTPYTVK
jgi:hypothetical protein